MKSICYLYPKSNQKNISIKTIQSNIYTNILLSNTSNKNELGKTDTYQSIAIQYI